LTWETRLFAAAAMSNGVASHRAAAALWRICDGHPLEVTTSNRPKDPSVIWHRSELKPADRTTLRAIPVTGIHRTLIDLGDVVADEVVEDALDRALERRLTSTDWLRTMIDKSGTRGRKGAAVLRSILDEGHEKASWLERRFVRLLGSSSIPSYFREFEVAGYFVDFAWPEVMLGVEVHGAKWHRKRKRWAKDLARHNDLTVVGWTILHFTWDEIKQRPSDVTAEILATYERLALRLGLTAH